MLSIFSIENLKSEKHYEIVLSGLMSSKLTQL
jgi:hypothetical protein